MLPLPGFLGKVRGSTLAPTEFRPCGSPLEPLPVQLGRRAGEFGETSLFMDGQKWIAKIGLEKVGPFRLKYGNGFAD